MTLPFFYINNVDALNAPLQLDEDTSRHIVSVLRMKQGELLHLTDGRGNLFTASIIDDHKKKCLVTIQEKTTTAPAVHKTVIGISLLKNTNRFEWFLEKATEIGVTEIIPLVCDRTEKHHFRYDRMNNILISAMLQSQQVWLPILHEPIGFGMLLKQDDMAGMEQKFIGHCIPGKKENLPQLVQPDATSRIMLIGPEGDFTPEEIETAVANKFLPVALGDTRLRTETAGMVAATLLNIY